MQCKLTWIPRKPQDGSLCVYHSDFSCCINCMLHCSDAETGNPLVAGFQDDLDPEDNLPNTITSVVNTQRTVDVPKKRESQTSLENEIVIESTETVKNEEFNLNGEIAEITADALDTWLSSDSKWRRSPEGGEDSNHSNSAVRDEDEEEDISGSLASSSVHLELLEPRQLQQRSGGTSPDVPRQKKNTRHKNKVQTALTFALQSP